MFTTLSNKDAPPTTSATHLRFSSLSSGRQSSKNSKKVSVLIDKGLTARGGLRSCTYDWCIFSRTRRRGGRTLVNEKWRVRSHHLAPVNEGHSFLSFSGTTRPGGIWYAFVHHKPLNELICSREINSAKTISVIVRARITGRWTTRLGYRCLSEHRQSTAHHFCRVILPIKPLGAERPVCNRWNSGRCGHIAFSSTSSDGFGRPACCRIEWRHEGYRKTQLSPFRMAIIW